MTASGGDFKLATAYVEFSARDAGATINGIKQVEDAFRKVPAATNEAVGGIKRADESLHGLLQSLRGYREVIGLSLGLPIGRMLFEQIHEGAAKAVEGFDLAREHGAGFFDSLAMGIGKAVGLGAALDSLIERQKQLKEVSADYIKTGEHMAELLDRLAHPNAPPKDLPNLSPADRAAGKKTLEESDEARKKAQEYAAPGRAEIQEQEKRVAEAKSRGSEVDEYNETEKLKELHDQFDKLISAADAAEKKFQEDSKGFG